MSPALNEYEYAFARAVASQKMSVAATEASILSLISVTTDFTHVVIPQRASNGIVEVNTILTSAAACTVAACKSGLASADITISSSSSLLLTHGFVIAT